jgi:hypothetical protein
MKYSEADLPISRERLWRSCESYGAFTPAGAIRWTTER